MNQLHPKRWEGIWRTLTNGTPANDQSTDREWCSSAHALEYLSGALIALGIWVAIILLPEAPFLSLLFLVGFAGPGVFLGHWRKRNTVVVVGGFALASWGYFLGVFYMASANLRTRAPVWQLDELAGSVMLGISVILVFAGLGVGLTLLWLRHKWLSSHRNCSTNFRDSLLISVLGYLFVMGPFLCAGVYDYNVRFDTSPPQVIGMRIVDKYIGGPSDDRHYSLVVSAEFVWTYGRYVYFDLWPSKSYYNSHFVGNTIEVTIHRGALGFPWISEYK